MLAATLVACGISAIGQLEGDAPNRVGDSGAPVSDDDATTSTDGDVPIVGCDGGAGVVFLPADGGACPSGTTEDTVQIDPQPGAGACSCGTCTPTADPSCNVGAISVDYGSNGNCSSGTLSYTNVPSDTCTDFGLGTVQQAAFEKWPARTPTGGSCTATAVPDPTKVTTAPLRRCVATSADAACLAASATLRRCVESTASCAGDYPVAVTYGDGATVTCGACACARGATKCIVEHFSDSACTQSRYMQDLNGVCTRTADATQVQYFKPHATGLTCVATPGAATPALTNSKTLCCTP